LNAVEVGQIAAAMGTELDDTARKAKAARLQGFEEPQPQEVLLAAGVATAPEFMDACRQVVAMIELPAEEFERHDIDGTLDDAVAEAAHKLRALGMEEARARASRALAHYAKAAGVAEGNAWSLLTGAIRQAFDQAMSRALDSGSGSSTGSATSTADGPATTSSTGSDTGTRSST
jgi:hypothetical protein